MTPKWPYSPAIYDWEGSRSQRYHFVQAAIAELVGPFDRYVFLRTLQSNIHLPMLNEELSKALSLRNAKLDKDQVPDEDRVYPLPFLPTDMTAATQWGWFEQLLDLVDPQDLISFDFTHGMRAVPIVFSSAIGFLKRAKGITLEHAFYGWFDPDKHAKDTDTVHPIVDMREFYAINEWAESVSRLTEDADARKLAELANQKDGIRALRSLGSSDLVAAFSEMTDCIRNVDVNNVGEKVRKALSIVEIHKKGTESKSARLLLDLVARKFESVSTDLPVSGQYDNEYFRMQLAIISVLLEHKLYMQAFTAMRECIASLGLVGIPEASKTTISREDGIKLRRSYAETFVNMLQFDQKQWRFNPDDLVEILPWYQHLQSPRREYRPGGRQLRISLGLIC